MTSRYAALIRHGDYHQLANTPSAFQPFGLNEQGEKQARLGAGVLKTIAEDLNTDFDPVIHCSSLLRAWQTAEIFKNELDGLQQITEFDGLAERSVGAVANLSVEQIDDVVKHDPRYDDLPQGWKSDSHYRLPFIGAESLMQAGERVAQHLRRSMTDARGLKLFVAHGASLRHAAHDLGILDFDDIAKLSMYHAHPVVFEVQSDGRWVHVAGDWKVRAKTDPNMD